MSDRCANYIEQGGLRFAQRCSRDASGDDGLCNVCRAAKRRGERARERNEELYRQRMAAQAERLDRQMSDQRVGAWLREHDPDRYAEIMEVTK